MRTHIGGSVFVKGRLNVEWWRSGVVEERSGEERSGGGAEWWRSGVVEWWIGGAMDWWSDGVLE
jgi:hypothetical protein